MEIGRNGTMVMIAVSILLISLTLPFGSANPIMIVDYKAGGSPQPAPMNTNVTFFKEFVKVDIDENETILLHADYWFRNEGNHDETVKILLPLSLYPRDIVLLTEGSDLGWYKSSYVGIEAIEFDLFIPQFKELKVTLEFREDLSKYVYSHEDTYNYMYSYFVGSSRSWDRPLENASFEFRIPNSICDSRSTGWNRTLDGSDYVFTKEYSNWLPADNQDFVSLWWEKYQPTPEEKQGGDDNSGMVRIIVVMLVIVLILVGVAASWVILHHKKKEKSSNNHRFVK